MRIFSLNVPDEYIDEGRLELNILIPVVGGNTSVNVPVETKETEAIMLLLKITTNVPNLNLTGFCH